ncbi:MAG: galactose mutarotase [Oscillospiraceae bacterium]|nr:galactose mutarotase [Oscillospiraceae bacterium]
MSIRKELLGTASDGRRYERYVLEDESTGGYIAVLNLGCILHQICIPDRNGELVDVALGYDTPEEYAATHSFFGAILGRYANRIANGTFTIDGKEYHVSLNERGFNSLHGGFSGFHNKIFDTELDGDTLVLTYHSPDDEEGYPGNLTLSERVSFRGGRIDLKYTCTTDKDTVVNISNHSFFNLNGQGNGDILEQELKLNCSCYCPCDDKLIPTGELRAVKGTPFDFTEGKLYGKDIHDKTDPMMAGAHGYDVCYAVDGWDGSLRQIATAKSERTGIVMKTYTTLPAMQLFTGNMLGMFPIFKNGKAGSEYVPYGAFCLETQNFPNAMNTPEFGNDVVLRAGQEVTSETVYEFGL